MKPAKKIKLLFRHRSMEMGGVEKVMLSIINHLDPEKFDITVLLSINQGELRNEFPKHIRKVYLAKGREEMSKNPFLQKVQLLQRKLKLDKLNKNPQIIDNDILKDTYDVEIAMTYNDFEPVLNSTNKNSKKIGWFHSEIQLPKLQPLVPKILEQFPQFDTMVYCSQKIKDLMHQYYPELDYPKEKVIVNAIPIEEIRRKSEEPIEDNQKSRTKNQEPRANSHSLKTFVSIGRLHTRKGYHTLMKAHQRLIKDGFPHQIIIVGDGEEKENLLHQRKDLNVEDSFMLVGNKMNPYPYVRQSDYFILSSKSEAWPLVLAEALILQKPTIATDSGDVAKVLDHNKTGLLINYDEDEMYQAMKRFLTEPALIEKFKNNLERIDKKFDNQKIFNEIENTIVNI